MNVRHDMITVFVIRPDAGGSSQEFLQLHRAKDDYLGETWQTVRGGVEPGEAYVTAAVRELLEETGLVPRELYRLGSVESFFTAVDDTLWHSAAFCAMVDRAQDVRLNEEHDAFRWTTRAEVQSSTMWASERSLLQDLFTDILDSGAAKPYLRIVADDGPH